ncbi:MAG: VOC family protein [Cytophagales bacterium]
MAAKIFVNLHVKDLNKSKVFYQSLGCELNEQFSDDTAASMVISDSIYIMLLTHEKFKQFTPKQISDASQTSEVLNALSVESREEVDKVFEMAIKTGGKETRPAQDHGFMYSRAFDDPDGHIWELFWMDMSQFPDNK